MQLISPFIAVFLIFGAFDAVWLSIMGPLLYRPVLGDILLDSLRIGPAIAFYALFPVGIVMFCVLPALKADSAISALVYGLVFGAIAYATYDLTNYATLKNWNLQITMIDIAYGAFASGLAAAGAVIVLRYLPASFGGTSG